MIETVNGGTRAEARQMARETLKKCAEFGRLPEKEQLGLYKSLVEACQTELDFRRSGRPGLARELAAPRKPLTAGDLIDDSRHGNKRIEQAGELAGDFMRQVDFPRFVSDLLKGVFDANLEVTLKQMKEYINLMKAATTSLATFVQKIDSAEAFAYLADGSDEFSLGTEGEGASQKIVLTDKQGNPVDTEDTRIKSKIMDAKIAMAKEHRALLRETILMGVSRLVVERGTVKASVIFDIQATEQIKKTDRAGTKDSSATSAGHQFSGGFLGSILGSPSHGVQHSRQSSRITVASAQSQGDTKLAAKVTGSVEIVFKSDYFKLDNFAQMYADVKQGAGEAAPGVPAVVSPANKA
jgi:hypothetical protein